MHGTSSCTSFSYSGYQYSSPIAGVLSSPRAPGSGLTRQPTKPNSFTQRSSPGSAHEHLGVQAALGGNEIVAGLDVPMHDLVGLFVVHHRVGPRREQLQVG